MLGNWNKNDTTAQLLALLQTNGNSWNSTISKPIALAAVASPLASPTDAPPPSTKRKLSRQSSTKSLSTLQPSSPFDETQLGVQTKRVFKFGAPEFERPGKKTAKTKPEPKKKEQKQAKPPLSTATPVLVPQPVLSSSLSVLDALKAFVSQPAPRPLQYGTMLPSFDDEAFPCHFPDMPMDNQLDDFQMHQVNTQHMGQMDNQQDYEMESDDGQNILEEMVTDSAPADDDLDALLESLLPPDPQSIPAITFDKAVSDEVIEMEPMPVPRRSLRISSRPNTRPNSPHSSPCKQTPVQLPPSFVLSSPIGTNLSSGRKAGLSPVFMGHIGSSPNASPAASPLSRNLRPKSRGNSRFPSPNPSPLKHRQRVKPQSLDTTVLKDKDAPSSAVDFEDAPQFLTIEEEEQEVQHCFNPPIVSLNTRPLPTMPGKHALPKQELPQDKESVMSRVLKRKRDMQMDLTEAPPPRRRSVPGRLAGKMQPPGRLQARKK